MKKKKIINEKSKITKKNPYSKSHLLAEKIILSRNQIENTKIVRASSVFGAMVASKSKEFTDTILNNFCLQLMKKKFLKVKNPYIVRNFLPFTVLTECIEDIICDKFKKDIRVLNLGYKSLDLNNLYNIVLNRINLKTKKKLNLNKFNNKKINKFKYVSVYKNYKFKWKIFYKEIDNLINIFLKKTLVK